MNADNICHKFKPAMSMMSLFVGAVVCGFLCLHCSSKDADGETETEIHNDGSMRVWASHMANKIQPTTDPGSDLKTDIVLEGARRSYVAAQLIISAAGGGLTGVKLTAGTLEDGNGNTISADDITFFGEIFIDYTGVEESEPGSMPVPANSPTDDPMIPDPLVPFVDPYSGETAFAPFDVEADRNQPVWVDFYIPEDAAPGTYEGSI